MIERFLVVLTDFLPLLAVLALFGSGLWALDRLILRRNSATGLENNFSRQIAILLLTAAATVAAILTLPVGVETRGQLLGLLGLVLTAVIALSSTTIVGNAMAGLMLRSVRSFGPGDFVRVGEQFGRVTERGLFHTEIQTEDRDLTTLPNMYLVAHPVTVVRSSGTIVSCSLSLGYDNAHKAVESALLEAAKSAQLDDPFVQILDLGDFAVRYRISGFLSDVKQLLSRRSKLRACVLDTLHRRGIEIVSPAFMNQRPISAQDAVIPAQHPSASHDRELQAGGDTPEDIIFDKAERAEKLESVRKAKRDLERQIAELRAGARAKRGDGESELSETTKRQIKRLEQQANELQGLLEDESRQDDRDKQA